MTPTCVYLAFAEPQIIYFYWTPNIHLQPITTKIESLLVLFPLLPKKKTIPPIIQSLKQIRCAVLDFTLSLTLHILYIRRFYRLYLKNIFKIEHHFHCYHSIYNRSPCFCFYFLPILILMAHSQHASHTDPNKTLMRSCHSSAPKPQWPQSKS